MGLLSGKYSVPAQWKEEHKDNLETLRAEYRTINTENVYPVEHFTYCDMLAHEMDIMPTLLNVRSWRTWLKIMLTPISTLHYLDEYFDPQSLDRQKIYTPLILVAFLTLMRVLGLPLRFVKSLASQMHQG